MFSLSLEEVKNFQNYDKLMNVLNKIKNPIKFFEFIKKSNTFSDLYIWYKEEAERQKGNKKLSSGGITYGSFSSSEEIISSGITLFAPFLRAKLITERLIQSEAKVLKEDFSQS